MNVAEKKECVYKAKPVAEMLKEGLMERTSNDKDEGETSCTQLASSRLLKAPCRVKHVLVVHCYHLAAVGL